MLMYTITALWLLFFAATVASAQNLTISSGGETGSSGTNWTVSLSSKINNKLSASAISYKINGNVSVVPDCGGVYNGLFVIQEWNKIQTKRQLKIELEGLESYSLERRTFEL